MYFLRTPSGLEADVVVENCGRLDLYDIKAGSTFHSDMASGLAGIAGFLSGTGRRTVIYSGRTLGNAAGAEIVNYAEMVF